MNKSQIFNAVSVPTLYVLYILLIFLGIFSSCSGSAFHLSFADLPDMEGACVSSGEAYLNMFNAALRTSLFWFILVVRCF